MSMHLHVHMHMPMHMPIHISVKVLHKGMTVDLLQHAMHEQELSLFHPMLMAILVMAIISRALPYD